MFLYLFRRYPPELNGYVTPEGRAIVNKLSSNLQYSVDIAQDNDVRKEALELVEQLSEDAKVIELCHAETGLNI